MMMKKRLFGCFLLIFAIGFTGCKTMKDDIDNLKKPSPTAVVILAHEIVAQNGSPIQIPFRVNPSNYVPTKEHITLDVVESEITRAAYGSSIPEYELTDVQPDKNAQGEIIDGQWLATVQVKEGAYYSDAAIALILDYTDAQGNRVQMTSTSIALMSSKVKLTDKMVALDAHSACTYMDASTTLALYTPVSLVALPISEGSPTLFDLETVAVESCELTGDNAEMFNLTADESGMKWSLGANTNIKFEAGAQFVEAQVTATLRDLISGTLVPITKTIKFFKTDYTLPAVEYKGSECTSGVQKIIQLGDALAQIGVTKDLFTKLTPHSYTPSGLSLSFHAFDETGQVDASEGYSAILRLKNTQEATPEVSFPTVAVPETNYLEQTFYAVPDAGKYMLKLSFQYSSPETAFNPNVRPTIKATINIPVNVIP